MRFERFQFAFGELRNALAIPNPHFAQRAGIIHLFNLAFELSWKVMRDYLQESGNIADSITSPRAMIKHAVQWRLVDEADGYLWLDALDSRNQLVHIYKEELALRSEQAIRDKFFSLLEQFHDTWETRVLK